MGTKPKRIVITGVSRGLGRAMTAGFIAAGHIVCGCARDAKRVAADRKQWPAPHRFDVVDVADDKAVARWAKTVLAEGPVDLVINNAALMNRVGPLWKVPREQFDELIDVNIKGVTNVIRHFVPAMVKRGSGVIVNFSSGWGRSVSAEVAPYCASKWAVEGLTLALAEELPKGVAAVSLNPGIIDTDMLRTCWDEDAANYPKPDAWARRAVPYLLRLGPPHNGRQLTVPGAAED